MSSRFALIGAVLFLIPGCASLQLNSNTMDLASTTDDLLQRQVLFNVEKFIDNDAAIPAQIVITSGAASTTNSVSPNLTAPLGSALTTGIATNGVKIDQALKNPLSLGVSASDTWSQNWGFAPITDVYQMRRLSALYRYAVDGDAVRFVHRYPLLYKSISITHPECLRDSSGVLKLNYDAGASGTTGLSRSATLCATQTATGGGGGGNGFQVGATTVSDSKYVRDEYYLKGPACAVCLRHGHLTKSENLQAGWLRWVNLPGAGNPEARPPLPGDRSLGVFGHHELFLTQGQGDRLAEFTLFVLAASTQVDATSASNGFSGPGGGRGGANRPGTQSLITPQGDVIPVVPSN